MNIRTVPFTLFSNQLPSQTNLCCAHIDTGVVRVPDELPPLPNSSSLKHQLTELLRSIREMEEEKDVDSAASSNSQSPIDDDSLISSDAVISRPKPPRPVLVGDSVNSSSSRVAFVIGSDDDTHDDHRDSREDSSSDRLVKLNVAARRLALKIATTETGSSYCRLLHYNTAIRSIFLTNFVQIFHAYESFLVASSSCSRTAPSSDGDDNLSPPMSGLNRFDKIGFLSDQPETALTFLSAFLETQMFSSFLDSSSVARARNFQEESSTISLFHSLIRRSSSSGSLFAPSHVICSAAKSTKNAIRHRPKLSSSVSPPVKRPGNLPDLLSDALASQQQRCRRRRQSDNIFPSLDSFQSADYQLTQGYHHEVDLCVGPEPPRFPVLSRNMLLSPSNDAGHRRQPRSPLSDRNSVSNIQPRRSLDNATTSGNRVHTNRKMTNSAPVSPPRPPSSTNRTPLVAGSSSVPPTKRQQIATSPLIPSLLHSTGPLLVVNPTDLAAGEGGGGFGQTTNWDFVAALLDEVKHKTKRMVLKKMGPEAAYLGHADPTISAAEENTLVTSFCDLLERIWSHGRLEPNSGKSALWSHLTAYLDKHSRRLSDETDCDIIKATSSMSTAHYSDDISLALPPHVRSASSTPIKSPYRSPAQSRSNASFTSGQLPSDATHRPGLLSLQSPMLRRALNALNSSSDQMTLDLSRAFGRGLTEPSLLGDIDAIRHDLQVSVKTDTGLARAFVRLALEKKLLSSHLTHLLTDLDLVKSIYARFAFLRCEEEREQFLIHLLSLNAVDYYSFSRMLPQAHLTYQLFLATGRGNRLPPGLGSLWFRLNGHLGSSKVTRPTAAASNLVKVTASTVVCVTTLRIQILKQTISDFHPPPQELYVSACASCDSDAAPLPPNHYRPPFVLRRPEDYLKASDHNRLQSTSTTTDSALLPPPVPPHSSFSTVSLPRWTARRQTTAGLSTSNNSFSVSVGSPSFLLRRHLHSSRSPNLQCFSQPSSPALLRDTPSSVAVVNYAPPTILDNAIDQWSSLADTVASIEKDRPGLGKEGKLMTFLCRAIGNRLLIDWLALLASSPVASYYYDPSSFLLNADLRQSVCDLVAALTCDDLDSLPFEPTLIGS